MKFTIYQLLADIFHNDQYKGRHELVITLPDGHEMSDKRAELIFLATLVDGAPRNVHYSTLEEISDTPPPLLHVLATPEEASLLGTGLIPAPENVVPFTPLQCEHRQKVAELGGLNSSVTGVTEGTPYHPGW